MIRLHLRVVKFPPPTVSRCCLSRPPTFPSGRTASLQLRSLNFTQAHPHLAPSPTPQPASPPPPPSSRPLHTRAGAPSAVTAPGNLPEGVPLEAAGDAAAAPDPIHSLRGLLEALELMDTALVQNRYLPKLLLYRCECVWI